MREAPTNGGPRSVAVAIGALVIAASIVGSGYSRSRTCTPRWRTSSTPHLAGESVLLGVTALSARQAWAVGVRSAGDVYPGRLLVEHWDGTEWSVVPTPDVRKGVLHAVAGVSERDAWAVGSSGARPLALHWNGRKWLIVATPDVGESAFYGVAAVNGNDVWAVGYRPRGALIEHWDGRRWSIVPGADPGPTLSEITVRAPNDIWAVGGPAKSGRCIEHWDGRQWRFAAIPMHGCNLEGVDTIAAGDAWAVAGEIWLHWTGKQWKRIVHSPYRGRPYGVGYELESIAAISRNDVWVVGTAYPTASLLILPYNAKARLHWDGREWNVTPTWQLYGPGGDYNETSSELHGVAAVSSTDVWAVGGVGGYESPHALIEHYTCPTASRYGRPISSGATAGAAWSARQPGSSSRGGIRRPAA